jgi:hypothetical protein
MANLKSREGERDLKKRKRTWRGRENCEDQRREKEL